MKQIEWSPPTGGDSETLRRSLQQALSGGEVELRLPPGRFVLSGGLKIHDRTRIEATPDTLVRLEDAAARNWDDFLLANADPERGNREIEIVGGIWDANGAGNPRGDNGNFDAHGGVGIAFKRVEKLRLADLTAANADSFFIRLCRVTDFKIERIELFNSRPRMNQDGVHLNGFCKDGVIREMRAISPFTPCDDMVALNADDGTGLPFMHGSELGPIENIEIEGLYAQNAHAFVRLLSQNQPIRHIRIRHLRGGARCNFLNINRWDFPPGKGNISDVVISDLEVHKMPWQLGSPAVGHFPLIDIALRVDDFEIRDLHRLKLDDGRIPTLALDAGIELDCVFESDGEAAGIIVDDAERKTARFTGKVRRFTLPDGGFRRFSLRKPTA